MVSNATRLPDVAFDLAIRLGADPACAFDTVSFSQTGSMRISLKSRLWLPFTARQTMSVRVCDFEWNARFSPFGYMSVTDALKDGVGRLNVTALGFIPVARSTANPALTRGELIRYLAELPLLPDAILHNSDIAWREIDASTVAATAGAGDTACEVIFGLGAGKQISTAYCADRAVSSTPPFQPMPWRCEFKKYRQQNGRWIPTEAQVGWVMDGKEDTYWKGAISDWTPLFGQTT